ncbi:MAG: hypothetical protein ACO3LH_12575 [Steroidobacteraceae bacterium]
MKLVFSESRADYAGYTFPYVVWGFPEVGETPADCFAAGVLPSYPDRGRVYLCRPRRVPLPAWVPSAENRRMLRKSASLECRLVSREAFDYSGDRRRQWLEFATERFGQGVMSGERLDRLMRSPVVSHLLVYVDRAGREVGHVLLYLEPPRVAYYYYAFYALDPGAGMSGMQLMTRAVEVMARAGMEFLHLGTCYEEKALYKLQFEPSEYFTGWQWSHDLDALRHLVRSPLGSGHLLEQAAHPASVSTAAACELSLFRTAGRC